MAEEEEGERKTVVEHDQENVREEDKTENKTNKDNAEDPTPITSTITTTTITGKRSRITDKDEEPNTPEEKRRPNKHKTCRTRVAVYGNYECYYGYRVLKESDDDPRLKYLKQEWFQGKHCLDVGCNVGNLTITIAKSFSCKSMVGVDIDTDLVYRAHKLLERTAKSMEANRKPNLDINHLNGEEMKATSCKTVSDITSNTHHTGLSGAELLERVSFKAENFISRMEVKPTYDTVLCLSVTKWVHLNWGDDGLIKLFAKIKNLLRPGGILVLEPQPWKSYKNKHTVSEVAQRNFREIVLRPDQFKEVLLDRVGFRSMENITNEIKASTKGFNRPIYLVRC